MTTFFDKPNSRLVFTRQSTSADYWDKHWQAGQLKEQIEAAAANRYYTNVTRRFLSPNSSIKILDGGCGLGAVVLSLAQAGYHAYGVDYAKQTITRVQRLYPELNLSLGDVTALDFPDDFLNGYWSLGVIEHYYDGYQPIINEMRRVIKPGGFLFITFPYLSPLRRFKSALRAYPTWSGKTEQIQKFYQFALSHRQVTADLQALGFTLRYQRPIDGLKGLKDEINMFKSSIKALTQSQITFNRKLAAGLGELTALVSGHITLGVYQRL